MNYGLMDWDPSMVLCGIQFNVEIFLKKLTIFQGYLNYLVQKKSDLFVILKDG